MNKILIISVGMVYLLVGINYFYNKNIAMGIVFTGYAIANYGLYLVG